MWTKEPRFEIGDSGYEVEWCSELAYASDNPDDGIDPDRCTQCERLFKTHDEAISFAKQIYPQDQFGSVRITPFTIEPLSDEWPYGRCREYTGDCEYYEGEDDVD